MSTAGQQAANEQTDAMTLWVAERTLRRYGADELADNLVAFAAQLAQGHLEQKNRWPLDDDASA